MGASMLIAATTTDLGQLLFLKYFQHILRIFCLKVDFVYLIRSYNILLNKYLFKEPPSKYVMSKKSPQK
jgi:hypothetical protein